MSAERPPTVYTIPDDLKPLPDHKSVALRFFSADMEERVSNAVHRRYMRELARMSEEEIKGSEIRRQIAANSPDNDTDDDDTDPVEEALSTRPPSVVLEEVLHAYGATVEQDVIDGKQIDRDARRVFLRNVTAGQARWLVVELLRDCDVIRETQTQQGEGGAG